MSESAVAVPVHRWPTLDALNVLDTGITTRHGGVSTGPYDSLNLGLHVGDDPNLVVENRRRAAMSFDAALSDLVFCNQTHSANIAVVTRDDRGRGTLATSDAFDDTDALITREPGVVLVIMVADCVPLVIVDPINNVLACVHAGWRGTANDITAKVVQHMCDVGADPSHMVAGIGPHVGSDRYVVGADVAASLQHAHPDTPASAITPNDQGDTFNVDLGMLNRTQLRRAGLQDGSIHAMDITTAHPDFFSDRAARPCGRFAVMARLREGTGQ